jgi:hypothetical protein
MAEDGVVALLDVLVKVCRTFDEQSAARRLAHPLEFGNTSADTASVLCRGEHEVRLEPLILEVQPALHVQDAVFDGTPRVPAQLGHDGRAQPLPTRAVQIVANRLIL